MNSKLGISSLAFRESSLIDALEKMRQTNLQKIDLTIILPTFCPHYNPLITTEEDDLELRDQIDSFGFIVSTINVVPGYYNTDLPETVDSFIKRAIDLASTLSAHSITIPSGAKVDTVDWGKNVLLVKKHLLEANKYASDKNVSISVETPHVRTLTETIEECQRFYEILQEPTIKCTLDTSHITRLEHVQVVEAIKRIGLDRVNHIHLRDAVGEEIDFTPGKGTCDFKSFFKYTIENNYPGDYILELEYGDITESRKFKEINFAIEYCQDLLNKGELSLSKKLQTNRSYRFTERLFRNPKAEIKRHKKVLAFIRSIKRKVYPYLPEKVYDGQWRYKIRLGKKSVVTQRKNSIKLDHKPEKIIRVGIVGCGWAGMEMHGPSFNRLEDVKIIGVYDIDPQKTKVCAAKFGAKASGSLDELIECHPDLISVCSREWAHYEAVMEALQNGIDVFCEKILATRYVQGLEMVNTARKYNRILGVNYNYHYIPGVKKIKEIIDQQALGKLAFFNINIHAFSYAHALDLLSFFGGKIVSVSAYYKNDNTIREFGGTDWSVYDEDILYIPSIATTVTVEFESGTLGVVNSSYYYNLNSFVMSIEAVFEGGVVSLSGINMFDTVGCLSYISKNKIRKVDMDYKKGVYAKGYEYTFYESIKDFIECYIVGKRVPTIGEKALFNMQIEKLITKSTMEGTKIRL